VGYQLDYVKISKVKIDYITNKKNMKLTDLAISNFQGWYVDESNSIKIVLRSDYTVDAAAEINITDIENSIVVKWLSSNGAGEFDISNEMSVEDFAKAVIEAADAIFEYE